MKKNKLVLLYENDYIRFLFINIIPNNNVPPGGRNNSNMILITV